MERRYCGCTVYDKECHDTAGYLCQAAAFFFFFLDRIISLEAPRRRKAACSPLRILPAATSGDCGREDRHHQPWSIPERSQMYNIEQEGALSTHCCIG